MGKIGTKLLLLSLWLQAQGKTVLDPDFDVDDGGLPREKLAVPKK